MVRVRLEAPGSRRRLYVGFYKKTLVYPAVNGICLSSELRKL